MSNQAFSVATSDIGGMHTLYDQHHSWLYHLLYRRLGDSFDAADLAQDTFVRLLLKPVSFDNELGARAYLNKVSKRLCIDLWRRREVEKVWLEKQGEQPELVAISPEQHNIMLEILQQLDQMLRDLPEKVATAFLLSQLKGMTYKQIAQILFVSERMVKKYMAEAIYHCALLEADLLQDL